VTFHGPGTLMAYPILDLHQNKIRVRDYVDMLEDVMIATCKKFGLQAYGRIADKRGIWVNSSKIGSVGISVKKWITAHGFALNVNTDLTFFDHITACNIQDVKITSLQTELNAVQGKRSLMLSEVEDITLQSFKDIFGKEIIEQKIENLNIYKDPLRL